ncbi:MAG TPA: hypothetical protein VGC94_01660 [Amnibacterium sp.]
MLLALYASIGNRATSKMLTAQRDVTNMTLGEGAGPLPSPTFMDAAQPQLDPAAAELTAEQRAELRRLTGNRISRAFTAFALAAEQKRADIKAAAADSPDFGTLLLEIAVGALLPALGAGIARLAAALPEATSPAAYRVALSAVNKERSTKLLETGVKFGHEALKGEAKLDSETEIDTFLDKLEDRFNKAADEIDKNLPSLSDDALGITCAAYDPSVSGRQEFLAAIEVLVAKYGRQVKPIGTTEYHWMNSESNFSLYWVVSSTGKKRLALLENTSLKEWISPDLQAIAIDKFENSSAGKYYHGQVPEIPAAQVDGLSG